MNNNKQNIAADLPAISQEQLTVFLMQAPSAIAVLNAESLVHIFVNNSYQKLVKRDSEHLLGLTIQQAFPNVVDNSMYQMLEQIRASGEPVTAADLLIKRSRDGVVKDCYYDVIIQPVKNAANEVMAIMLQVTDVTIKAEANKKLQQNEQELNLMANAMPQVVWIAGADARVRYTNERILNFAVKGKNDLGLWDWKDFTHPDDLIATAQAWQRCLQTGQGQQIEHRFEMKNGQYRWHFTTVTPYKDKDGKILKWYGTTTDIHDQKTFAQKLETSVAERTSQLQLEKDFIETILNASNDIIAVIDKKLNYVVGNSKMQQQYGLEPEQFIGRHILDVFPKMKDSEFIQAIEKGLKGETILLQGYKSVLVNRWYQNFFVPLKQGNEVYAVVIVAHDITDMMEASDQIKAANLNLEEKNQELLRTNKELESFTYIASHDLQEPLRKIQMFIQLLNKNKQDETQREKYIEKINSSALRMSQLIDAILDYSRISGTKEKLELIDLNETLNVVRLDFEMLVEEKKAVINSNTLPVIEGVGVQLSQLFSNLIGNALKFASQNPVINISARILKGNQLAGKNLKPEADYVELKFADNGIGFEPQYAERIFQLFQRLHGKSEYAGTGVGLSIVKKIAEHHQGYIYAQSEPGMGATFVVVLPLKQDLKQ